jgi:protein-L-isoaspartate O-methyltransferase
VNSQEIIARLRQKGITNSKVFEAVERFSNVKTGVSMGELLKQAQFVQMIKPTGKGNILVLGEFPVSFYFIMGNIAHYLYFSEPNGKKGHKKCAALQKAGFGNIHTIDDQNLDKYMPYDQIVIEQSKENEPHFFIDKLVEGGTLTIKTFTETKETIKITKTSDGFIRENYS